MAHVKVGLGVVVIRNFNDINKVLLGQRKGSHGEGTWSFPGGHQEFGENWENCIYRETAEEVGEEFKIDLIDKHLFAITDDYFEQEEKHYNILFFIAKYLYGETEIMEPHKCLGWEWYSWQEIKMVYQNIKKQLFLPIQNLIKQKKESFL
jgi:8-oxo-dGTP diphosphatase